MTDDETLSTDSLIIKASSETFELLEWQDVCKHLASFASTTQGKRFCKCLPVPNQKVISQSLLEETKEINCLDQEIEGGLSFQGIYDIENIINLCTKGGIASGEELLAIAKTLASSRRLRKQIYDEELRPELTSRIRSLVKLPELERTLKFGLENSGRIADCASESLAVYRRKINSIRQERNECMHDLIRTHAYLLNDSVISERKDRLVLSVKASASAQFPGIVLDISSSGNTVFVEPQAVVPLGNALVELQLKAFQEERKILYQWSQEIAKNSGSLQHLNNILTSLDVALARARYSFFLKGFPPVFCDINDSEIVLKELRHPILLWNHLRGSAKAVRPISLDISSELRVVAITGPNTGGKTVSLKTIGLAALMAKSGLFLPCSGSPRLPWFDNVLADIGDDQSIQQNLSTFSGHMQRIGRILSIVDDRNTSSLVLLDEIGAGTDPSEGTALAISLLKTFADKARLTIATTHFGELKSLKYNDSRFENASVAFDSVSLSPTYDLQWGIPGRSNALLIASRLGLSRLIIERAEDLLNSNSYGDVNTVIEGLEKQRDRQQIAAENAAALLARTELLHEKLLKQWELDSKKNEEKKESERQKLLASIQAGQQEVRRLINQLRKGNADGNTARIVGQRLRQIKSDNLAPIRRNKSTQWVPKIGDQVRLLSLGKAGQVLEISEDGLQLTIRCGVLRSKVHLESIESLEGEKPKLPETIVKVQAPLIKNKGSDFRTSKNTVDVRGLRVHEAEVVVEDFLRNSAGPIWIIHGIGTGKLKKGLRQWLESSSYVAKIRDAAQEDGGAGCSVVWLK